MTVMQVIDIDELAEALSQVGWKFSSVMQTSSQVRKVSPEDAWQASAYSADYAKTGKFCCGSGATAQAALYALATQFGLTWHARRLSDMINQLEAHLNQEVTSDEDDDL